jgi:(+)-trans-carveol dehydrogenase
MNPAGFRLFMGDPNATREQAAVAMQPMNALPVPWVEDRDISNAVLFLASEEARYITGQALAVDAGAMQPFKLPHPPDADSE